MWIGSWIHLTARQPYASTPGYQSPASGDNVPDPGSQDTTGVQPHHGSAPPSPCHNNDNLVNSTPCLLLSCTHREDTNASLVSQWWGHRGLHQHEVLECRRLGRKPKVSLIDEIRRLTTIPRLSTICTRLTSSEDEASDNLTNEASRNPC